jgi:hypothetical protein
MMKCPGQDSRYWTGDVVIEVPCPECGSAVEIFKDESAGRCRGCGHRFLNPGADFGCAKWCSLAQECLGFAPARPTQPGCGEGALAARLIQWIERQFRDDPARIARALKAFQRAKEFIRKEGGDPRVVLSATLLLATGAGQQASAIGPSAEGGPPESMPAETVLESIGLEADVLAVVCHIVDTYRKGDEMDTVEFRVVRDSLADKGAIGSA